jgi:hypothetical protein
MVAMQQIYHAYIPTMGHTYPPTMGFHLHLTISHFQHWYNFTLPPYHLQSF